MRLTPAGLKQELKQRATAFSLFLVIHALTLGQALALETPLILPQQGTNGGTGTWMAVVNPSLGTMYLYQSNGEQIKKSSTVYFADKLFRLAHVSHPSVHGGQNEDGQMQYYSYLRVGDKTKPAYGEWLTGKKYLGASKKGQTALTQQAINTENEFWDADAIPEYDGVVRGAFAKNSLMLCIPSMRTLLLYTLKNGTLELASYRNFGPDFYPSTYNTASVKELAAKFPKEQKDAFIDMIEQRKQALVEDPDAPLPMETMDPWIQSLENESYVIFDPANDRMLTYNIQNGHINLRSSRSTTVDFMVPSEIKSTPTAQQHYDAYLARCKKYKEVPYDEVGLTALLSTHNSTAYKNTDENTVQAVLKGGFIFLDMTARKRLLTYQVDRNQIKVCSIRNYTAEAASSIHISQIRRKLQGLKDWGTFEKKHIRGLKKADADRAFNWLELILTYNPSLYEEVEKERALVKLYSDDPRWKDVIDTARTAREAEIETEELRKEAIEKIKEERKKR